MVFIDFVDKSKQRYRKQGPSVIPSICLDFTFSTISRTPILPRWGKNVFSEEWDVLLILDACRYDMYTELIGETDRIWSVGSSSGEWMDHTFTDKYSKEIQKTAYVTGNPFSDDRAPDEKFGVLDEVWREKWDSEKGTIPPRPITDRVIDYHRSGSERVVGHYMQPHYPFIGGKEGGGKMQWEVVGDNSHQGDLALWDQFLYGVRDDLGKIRKAYYANLEYVWKEVEIVLSNVEGKVVITADHGNALGELGGWGHRPGFLHPKMRWVPWDVRRANDEGTHEPNVTRTEVNTDREEQLKNLGYLE